MFKQSNQMKSMTTIVFFFVDCHDYVKKFLWADIDTPFCVHFVQHFPNLLVHCVGFCGCGVLG